MPLNYTTSGSAVTMKIPSVGATDREWVANEWHLQHGQNLPLTMSKS
jgi:DICT domain-containing protein